MFLEDQILDDANEKPESNSEVPVNLDPAPSPIVRNYEGDTQPDRNDEVDDEVGEP